MSIKLKSYMVFLVFAINAKAETIREFLVNNAKTEEKKIRHDNHDYHEVVRAHKYSTLASNIVSCMDEALGESEKIKFKKCYCEQMVRQERIFSKYNNETFVNKEALRAQESLKVLKELGEEVAREKNIDLTLDLSN